MLHGKRLLLLLRAEDDIAYATVESTLTANRGDVMATARALGVSSDSLYLIARRFPAFGERFRKACQGLEGARAAALRVRRQRAAERLRARAAEMEAAAHSTSNGRS